MTSAVFERFRQSEPLPCHLVSIIGVNELIIIHAIRCVSLHSLDSGSAAVQLDDVVHERLTGRTQRDRLGRVGLVVVSRMGLAGFVVLAWSGGGDGSFLDVGVCGHDEWRCMELAKGAVGLI